MGQDRLHGIHPLHGLREGRRSGFLEPVVREVEGLQNEVRGACGAKQTHSVSGTVFETLGRTRSDVQVPAAGQDRQGLVGGVRAGVGAEGHGVPVFFEELQVRAVGVVHEQQRSVPVRDLREAPDVQDISEVVRRRHEDSRHSAALAHHPLQLHLESVRRDGTAAEGVILF